MSNERKTSEELIREARNRLSSGGEAQAGSEAPVDDVGQPIPGDPHESSSAIDVPHPSAADAAVGEVPAPVEPAGDEMINWQPDQVEPRAPRKPFFTTRWFRLVALLAVGLGYGFFTSLDDANRGDTGEIVSGGDLDVMSVQPGDCFNDPASEDEVVFQLEAIPCSAPHDNEVFAVESIAGTFDSNYPGRQTLEERAYEVCSGPIFDSYVGTPYLDSTLDVFTLTPTDDSWSDGDRDIVCVLYKLDFTKLTGPARDSGL